MKIIENIQKQINETGDSKMRLIMSVETFDQLRQELIELHSLVIIDGFCIIEKLESVNDTPSLYKLSQQLTVCGCRIELMTEDDVVIK